MIGAKVEKSSGKDKIVLKQGDITRETADALVNAANSSLLGGGGVDGAIHRAGGPRILEECRKIREEKGSCPTGGAVLTTGGNLKARFVVHAVGPVWQGGGAGEAALLDKAYRSSLQLALDNEAVTVAFPSISTGAYGFPIEKAAPIALRAVAAFCEAHPAIEEVRFVLFSAADLKVYQAALEKL